MAGVEPTISGFVFVIAHACYGGRELNPVISLTFTDNITLNKDVYCIRPVPLLPSHPSTYSIP